MVLGSLLLLYVFKINRRIIGGVYQGYFEVSNGNYSHMLVTLGVVAFFFILISCLAANINGVRLFIHKDPFSQLKLLSKTPLILGAFVTFIVSSTNDIFTFWGYSNKYLMIFKFASFYFMLAYGTLCLCIYYSGRTSTTYCLANGFRFILKQLPYALISIAVLAGIAFGSMVIGSEVTGQNIILLEDFNVLGVVKSICITLSIMLGTHLYKKSEIQKFCTNCV